MDGKLSMMGMLPEKRSSLVLIFVSNLIPLFGVLWWEWDLANVVLLYWTENLVIGFWTLVKMITAGGGAGGGTLDAQGSPLNVQSNNGCGDAFGKVFLCGFFTVHYGMFCMGHAAFILMILGAGNGTGFFPFKTMMDHGLITSGVLTGTAVMLVTHGIDFVKNYLMSENRKTATAHAMMFTPYGHIVVVHIAILAGAAISMAQDSPFILLFLIVVGKMILEIVTLKVKEKLMAKAG
ncbi:hypothetical protein NT6N_06000 [Oceaniferula spumae]|uniref:Uncharacterized protein n=1 Tax=Oceaniferula spumae TaxID=2979115 RepID=A0AAT9FHX2_9BACT